MKFTRDLTPSVSQSLTYEAQGLMEDLSPVITNIDPEVTYFLSNLPDGKKAENLEFAWLTEGLKPAGQNAHPEKVDYEAQKVGSMAGLSNYQQHFINSGWVSDAQRRTAKVYNEQDEFLRQMLKASREQARDMEYMIVNNAVKRVGNGDEIAALSGGIPYFMQTELQAVTITTSSGLFTTTEPHGLVTGDFVYFKASTMPDGLDGTLCYYVEKVSDTTFNIYNTLQGAAEKVVADKVIPDSAGTGVNIMKSNIVDKGGSSDFTVEDMQVAMQMAYNRGGNPTDAFMSGSKKQRFSTIVNALATTNRKASDKTMQVIADTFSCDFGTVTAHAHRLYPDNRIDLLDLNYWEKRWFEPSHQVKNLAKTGSYERFVMEGWLGLQGTQPKASASIINVKRK